MPKRTIAQKRGRGMGRYTATKHAVANSQYINYDDKQRNSVLRGEVIDLVNDAGRTAVLANITFETGESSWVVATESMYIGQQLQYGKDSELSIGNVIPLKYIVEGCPICNIEKNSGDGGTFIRASGMYGLIVTKDANLVYVKLPSGKTVSLRGDCRAMVGCIATGGRGEKPFVKAGNKYYAMKARKHRWPKSRGVKMNAVDHPFGGAAHKPGKSKSTARRAAPGRKVGSIASKRTGRRKKN
ncbi:MAG: 50S ribosomal protein L2 [Candidatus Diapherotrites archaeon]